ncbi:MAG: hypothetical protein HY825_00655 [Acidobacteria bacterium]|nr:hypothetical protein [Acidobacteriota bacterium]
MRWMVVLAVLFVVCGLNAEAEPTISFEPTAVVVSGVTSGGEVALYGVAHDFRWEYPAILWWARSLIDEKQIGTVSLDLGQGVPEHSLWIAVDMTTGESGFGSPRAGFVRQVDFQGPGVGNGPDGEYTAFRAVGGLVDIVVVRPGTGLWLTKTGDGGAADADGTSDGVVTAVLSSFEPVGDSPLAPETFDANDIVIVVDPKSMKFSIVVVN